MQPKRIHINRGSLSPFTSSAIRQLMAEFNRREDVKQCLELKKAFAEKAEQLKKLPCRQPSKKKKRTEADKAARAEWMRKRRLGTESYKAAQNFPQQEPIHEPAMDVAALLAELEQRKAESALESE
jgi:hypothetical protein